MTSHASPLTSKAHGSGQGKLIRRKSSSNIEKPMVFLWFFFLPKEEYMVLPREKHPKGVIRPKRITLKNLIHGFTEEKSRGNQSQTSNPWFHPMKTT